MSTAFIGTCYGYEDAETMSDVRFKMWKAKTEKANIVSAPKLMSLPQTNESFKPKLPRANLECCIWKHVDESNPPDIDPTRHGWKRDAINKNLTPTVLPANTPAVPDSLLYFTFVELFCHLRRAQLFTSVIGIPICLYHLGTPSSQRFRGLPLGRRPSGWITSALLWGAVGATLLTCACDQHLILFLFAVCSASCMFATSILQ